MSCHSDFLTPNDILLVVAVLWQTGNRLCHLHLDLVRLAKRCGVRESPVI